VLRRCGFPQIALYLGVLVLLVKPLGLYMGRVFNGERTFAERAAATWAWQHNQPAGRGSDTLPGTEWFYLRSNAIRLNPPISSPSQGSAIDYACVMTTDCDIADMAMSHCFSHAFEP
jgi:hypothetical protein